MARRPTIADIARVAAVSTATVDRVLNGRGAVQAATAQKVCDAAEAIGYHAAPLIRARLQSDLPVRRLGLVLQKETQEFYQRLSQEFDRQCRGHAGVQGRAEIVFATSQDPAEQAARLADLGRRCHAVGATAVNHPETLRAVRELQGRGVPVFALMNDFAIGQRHAYVGLNNLRIGRMAGWTIQNVARGPGKVAIFVGGSRWHGHELRETGFRSYFRDHPGPLSVLEPLINLENRSVTYEASLDLLKRHSDLRGIFVAGGGMEGAIEALREQRGPGDVSLVVNELTDISGRGLQDGYVTLINRTPLERLCTVLIQAMLDTIAQGIIGEPRQIFLQSETYLPESLG